MPLSQDTFDPSVEQPRMRAWLHQVLAKLWGGAGYLPERLREEERSIPALTLGALANVYILALTHHRTCQSLWEEDGALQICWTTNEEVLSGQMCFDAQMGLQGLLGIDCSVDEQQPRCDIARFRELGGRENDDMATKLSNFIVDLERRFELAKQLIERPGQDVASLEMLKQKKRSINNAIRLPIAGFVREHQLHAGECCGSDH
ncbi:unnamed protein product [Clonostachys rosea f. rosea IK726]|uniref:Uncharacterized protein n=1 Tax=Clonostachys rosea f. rosea IK726 TaxID=1349383 RepID=A0ACA9U025_BIOOC|nr:unnamed protein product [Clonostachys rosea f. rosea IK726]